MAARDYKRLLVLGGSGFIGTHLLPLLYEKGFAIRTVSRQVPVASMDRIEVMVGDFNDMTFLRQAVGGCDGCIQLVTTTLPEGSNERMAYDVETNLIGNIRLLEMLVESKCQKFIFLSSGGTVYGEPKYDPVDERHPTDPKCSYGITKLAVEKYIKIYRHLHQLDATVLRVANPYGGGQRPNRNQGVIPTFLSKNLLGEPVEIWGDGTIVRDYVYASDVADAIWAALNYSGDQTVFNIGSGVGFSLLEIIAEIEAATGRPMLTEFKPSRTFDVARSVLDIRQAVHDLHWRPNTELKQGLVLTRRAMFGV